MGEEFNSLMEVLVWLTGAGGAILTSYVLERLVWFQSLESNKKHFVAIALSSLVGIGALAVLTFVPQEIISQISPYFMVVVTIVGYIFSSKAFHFFDKQE